MEIQDESLLPSLPLETLESDYENAVLHIAWVRHAKSNEQRLLFAFVELIPSEIPPPLDDFDPQSQRSCLLVRQDDSLSIYVWHAVVSAGWAIRWYLDCRAGVAVLPGDGGPLKLADLGEATPWPTLIACADRADTVPFCPQWVQGPRVHHLLPLAEFSFDELWAKRDQDRVRGWLEDRLHFDLGDYPEYWGSIHLVAPNPVYRDAGVRLQPRTPPAESVLVRFRPRAGKSVSGLELQFREREQWGITGSRSVVVRSQLMRVNFERKVDAVLYDVWDPTRGFLEVSEGSHTFIRGISTETRFGESRTVKTREGSYEVTRIPPSRKTNSELPKVASADARLTGAYFGRQKKKRGHSQNQQWFHEQRSDAKDALRALLKGAYRNVMFVDPKFSADDVDEFLLAVEHTEVPIQILLSEVSFRSSENNSKLQFEHLVQAVEKIRADRHANPCEIRVLRGERSPIQAQFIIADDRAWSLSTSLHEFGVSGSLLVGVPDAEALRIQISEFWRQAVPLAAWGKAWGVTNGSEGA